MNKAWLSAFRPKTLTAAVVPIVCATALVSAMTSHFKWWIPVLALLCSLCIQIATNLFNDAIDHKKGADTAERIGPQRVTQAGIFAADRVMQLAYIFIGTALLLGIPLVMEGGLPILILGVASLACAYLYTGGPFPLAYTGLGDLFVVLFFGLIAVTALVFLMVQQVIFEALWLGLQVGLLCAVLIAINNLRDMGGDKKVNKKTLPVRFGLRFARTEIAALVLIPFVMQMFWIKSGLWLVGGLPLILLPRALMLVRCVYQTEPSPAYNGFLEQAAKLHLLFGLLISLGLAL